VAAGRLLIQQATMPSQNSQPAWIGLCESQPATAEGLRFHLSNSDDLRCRWAVPHLGVAMQLVRQQPVDLLLIDKVFGHAAIAAAISELRLLHPAMPVLVWGAAISESEALRFLQAGASGLLAKTASIADILHCMRALRAGGMWFGDLLPADGGRRSARCGLTQREQQVLELVERGMKNKEIASALGIRPGTVKIHLKHIFEKKGVHGRYGLALTGFQQRAESSWANSRECN